MHQRNLSELRQGETCAVTRIDLEEDQVRRLRDLGMEPGTTICCARVAPSGSPMAFWIKGAQIALRADACRSIQVTTDV